MSYGNGLDTNDELPDSIDFDNSDVRRSLVRKKLRAHTWYRGKCTNAKFGTWPKTGKVFLETEWSPVTAEGKVKTPSARFRLTLPYLPKGTTGPDGTEVNVPDTFKMCYEFMHALYPNENPTLPTFNYERGVWVRADGESITKEAAKSLAEEIISTATKKITSTSGYYGNKGSNAKELIGEYAFFLTEDNEYRGVRRIASDVPDSVSVQYTDLHDPNVTE